MSAAEKIVLGFMPLTDLERCPLARRYRWHAPIQDWNRRTAPMYDDRDQLYARPVLRERKRTPDDELREQIRRQDAERQAKAIADAKTERARTQIVDAGPGPLTLVTENSTLPDDFETLADELEDAQLHPQPQQAEEEGTTSSPTLLQETPAETSAAEPYRTETPPSLTPAGARRGRGGHYDYPPEQKVTKMIAISPQLKTWLDKLKKHGETVDDVIRRIGHLHPRTPI